MPNPAWDRVEQLRAENDALAQRLADADRNCAMFHVDEQVHDEEVKALLARATRAEAALRHIATWQPEMESDAEIVTLLRDQAAAALTPTEEPPPTISHTLSGSFCDECGARLNDGTHLASCSALTPTEEPHNPWGGSYTKQRSSPTEEPEP